MLRTTYCYLSFATLALASCQSDRPLGDVRNDLNDASSAGSGGARSSYDGGGSVSGGSSGAGALAGTDGGGALGGTNGAGALGGTGGAGALGGTGGAGSYAGDCGLGGGRGATDAGPDSGECFSPFQNTHLAVTGGQGCPCGGDGGNTLSNAVCAPVNIGDLPYFASFHCVDGRWARVVEGGVCEFGPGTLPACKLGPNIYPNGTRGIPDPNSCNTCVCVDGHVACTERYCPLRCPVPGLVPGTSCYRCSPVDACDIVEYGWYKSCANDMDCHGSDTCLGGICRNVCG
jgi:hypothetical protein